MQYPANRRKSINACFFEILRDLGPRYYQMARLWEKTQVWGVAKRVYALQACIYSVWVGSIFNFPGFSTAWTFFSNNVLFTSEDQKSFKSKPCLVTRVWAVPKKREGTLKTPEMKNVSHRKVLRWTKQGNMQLYIRGAAWGWGLDAVAQSLTTHPTGVGKIYRNNERSLPSTGLEVYYRICAGRPWIQEGESWTIQDWLLKDVTSEGQSYVELFGVHVLFPSFNTVYK